MGSAKTEMATTSSKELEKAGIDDALMRELAVEALSEIDRSTDVRLPSLVMYQGTSQWDDGKPGDIIHTLSGEAFASLEMVVLRVWKSRRLFGPEIGTPPICLSADSHNGYGEVADDLVAKGIVGPRGDSGACDRCPETRIREGRCKLQYNFLAILVGEGHDFENAMPVVVTMQSTSAKVGTRLNGILLNQRYPWTNVIDLSTRREENEFGKYHVWAVSKGREAEPREQMAAVLGLKSILDSLKRGENIVVDDSIDEPAPPKSTKNDGDDTDIPF